MRGLRKWHFVLVMVYFHGCGSAPRRKQRDSGTHIFYAVQLDGDSNDAKSLAERHGLKFISKIGNLEGHYTFKDHKGVMSKKDMVERLSKEHLVKWVEHQRAHYRDKRAVFSMSGDRTGHEFIQAEREIPIAVYSIMNSDEGLKDPVVFNDPYWPMQWELYNHGQYGGPKRFDLNIMPVWKRGISGRGVVVTIIDDGVDPTNRDLRSNFDLYASFDLRDAHGLSHDPTPPSDLRSGHGTRCAGEIAMVANNSFCGVGIAFNSRIGGIRLLDGPVTDAMEATSLTYNNDYIDIYSCCWGPKDNGKKMGGPGILTKKALRLGAEKGRNGKGSIFVWASGNGGMVNDHCGADGYVNSIYTIAIGAITHYGFPAFFGEPCPAVMAVTLTGAPYSLFGGRLPLVTSSNTDDGCVTHFTGTSSAAPMAAGVLALVLEANPDLTWRDVQHLIARTAKIPNPVEPGWRVNGGGHHVHDRYGFGLLDAGMMVQHALKWTQVRQQRKCSEELLLQPGRIVSPGESVTVSLNVNACKATKNVINVLEHVQPVVSISSVCRGDLTVDLISPFGTKSRLLGTRHNDISDTGMKNWTFMSVHFWEEEPEGIWKLKVQDHKNTAYKCYRPETEDTAGVVVYIKLILYGTYDLKKKNMGKETPVLEDSSLQQQIIEKDFIQENTAKVNAGDIPLIQRKKISKVLNSSKMALSYAPEEMDDTDGSNFAAHLKLLWNTVRENVVASWAIYTSRPDVSFTKVQLLDPLIRHYIKEKYLLSSDQSAREHFDAKKDLGAYTDSAKLSAEDLLEILKRDVKKLHMLKEMMDALDKLVHEK